MQQYPDKQALLFEIEKTYRLFDKEFDAVAEESKALRIEEVDKTPQEMLAYQLGWLRLVLSWEQDEAEGRQVITPSPDYKWNQLGRLYQHFYDQYSNRPLQELRSLLRETVAQWQEWISKLTEDELFQPNRRKWTVTSANWPLWKWIHINSVAPFRNFRTKIRKWKKHAGQASPPA
ncbi:MAG: ClbS/DfsB family four-helix bundle protein [Sporomusaceae bacterium]|nr:ClbS/DfsB family four-helix bundle protein [Sporomusaceae bacterium]